MPAEAIDRKSLFGTIEKVETNSDGTIRVHGVASTEAKDDQGEIVRATAMRAAIPEYLKFPAIRSMHQPIAAGRALEIDVGDDRVTRLVAHIVDPIEISKVKNKVYNGFSIGGRVTRRDPADHHIITALQLNEISLVDRPANPEAVFDCWKRSQSDAPSAFDPTATAGVHARNGTPPPSEGWVAYGARRAKEGNMDGSVVISAAEQSAVQKFFARFGIPAFAGTSAFHKGDGPREGGPREGGPREGGPREGGPREGGDPRIIPGLDPGTGEGNGNGAIPGTARKGGQPGDYGDVEYADEGLQSDGKRRYPIDTEAHIRAAWSYIHRPKNAGKYTDEQVKRIKAKIVAAWKDKIDPKGPPAAEEKKKAAGAIASQPGRPSTGSGQRPSTSSEAGFFNARSQRVAKAIADIGEVAWLMQCLATMKDRLEYEAAIEGDDNPQPARLAGIVRELADFLLALGAEETAELIEGDDPGAGSGSALPSAGPMGPVIGLAAQGGGKMQAIAAMLEAVAKRHGGHQHLMDMAHAGMRKLLDDGGDGYTREGDQHLKDMAHMACHKCLEMEEEDGLTDRERGHMVEAKEAMKAAGAREWEDGRSFAGPREGGEHSTQDTGRNPTHPAPTAGGADPTTKLAPPAFAGAGLKAGGARHSREIQDHLHKAHFHLTAAGAKCDCAKSDALADERAGGLPGPREGGEHRGMTSRVRSSTPAPPEVFSPFDKSSGGDKSSGAGDAAARASLQKTVADAMAPLNGRVDAIEGKMHAIDGKLDRLLAQPTPAATIAAIPEGIRRVVKGGGEPAGPGVADVVDALTKMSDDDRTMALIRMAHLLPNAELTRRYGGNSADAAVTGRT